MVKLSKATFAVSILVCNTPGFAEVCRTGENSLLVNETSPLSVSLYVQTCERVVEKASVIIRKNSMLQGMLKAFLEKFVYHETPPPLLSCYLAAPT